jgi:hypothetical protein
MIVCGFEDIVKMGCYVILPSGKPYIVISDIGQDTLLVIIWQKLQHTITPYSEIAKGVTLLQSQPLVQ